MQKQLHAIVHGRVQGVGFRYNAQAQAQHLNLVGWVRNLSDGSVETVAVGEQHALEKYLHWLYVGPLHANVLHIDATWSDKESSYSTFEII